MTYNFYRVEYEKDEEGIEELNLKSTLFLSGYETVLELCKTLDMFKDNLALGEYRIVAIDEEEGPVYEVCSFIVLEDKIEYRDLRPDFDACDDCDECCGKPIVVAEF